MDKQKFEMLKNTLETDPSYKFLKENELLKDRLLVLGLGGSYAYGTDREGSDIDVRGAAFNSPRNICIMKDFEQYVDEVTDTTIYSFDKILSLLAENNPNTLEILGLSDDQIFYKHPVWDEILDNQDMFLSRRAIATFGGYANAQLRRLENKAVRDADQTKREENILNSINFASEDFRTRYQKIDTDSLKLFVAPSDREDMDSEIFVDLNVSNYPLRDLSNLFNDYHSVIRGYEKMGKRNQKAIEHDKLGKHMMHLVRLYYMCFDILETHTIKTYRDIEHDFLMEIRFGSLLDENKQPSKEFYQLVNSLDAKLKALAEKTTLPELPDYERILDFRHSVNKKIVKGLI